jgi:hypothetical protein
MTIITLVNTNFPEGVTLQLRLGNSPDPTQNNEIGQPQIAYEDSYPVDLQGYSQLDYRRASGPNQWLAWHPVPNMLEDQTFEID